MAKLKKQDLFDYLKHNFSIIHGPCAIESEEQMNEIVKELKSISLFFRGGSYKPRTSPYTFQGLKEKGIEIIRELKQEHDDIYIVSEITSINDLNNFNDVDVIQIGARNMQNYELLKQVAKLNKPILLKRGFAATIEELISSVSYIEKEGNNMIILCERGIRTFSTVSRFTLDFSAVGYLLDNYDYPVIIDPSHAAGYQQEVLRLTKAAVAYGCNGLLIEVHPNPQKALSDKNQQLSISQYKKLIKEIKEKNGK